MKHAFIIADNIISSLGFSSKEVFENLIDGKTGIKEFNPNFLNVNFPFFASAIDNERLANELSLFKLPKKYTRFEEIVLLSILKATENLHIDLASPKTLFILSSTKGNVDFLEKEGNGSFSEERIYLWKTASLVADFFNNPNQPLVVSNACISGLSALITAQRLIKNEIYDHIIICGADILSRFIITGFNSLHALSPTYCAPYDILHQGLNLGEGAATIVLSSKIEENKNYIEIENGAITNDANHISGPSRTGEGLHLALLQVIKNRKSNDFAFINTHGTATIFNDNMEAIALYRTGLSSLPVSSIKGALGHTMGAAGIIESIISAHALIQQIAPKTIGFKQLGTPEKINVLTENLPISQTHAIKTASGFGGCNAALILAVHSNSNKF
jgi:3-oxoacyl-[acyl-carrier-protein] synthase-1